MKCVYDGVALSRYLEQDLPEEEMAGVVEHLAGCPVCQRELERLRTAMTIMKSAEQVAAPRDYAEAVRLKMREKDLST